MPGEGAGPFMADYLGDRRLASPGFRDRHARGGGVPRAMRSLPTSMLSTTGTRYTAMRSVRVFLFPHSRKAPRTMVSGTTEKAKGRITKPSGSGSGTIPPRSAGATRTLQPTPKSSSTPRTGSTLCTTAPTRPLPSRSSRATPTTRTSGAASSSASSTARSWRRWISAKTRKSTPCW